MLPLPVKESLLNVLLVYVMIIHDFLLDLWGKHNDQGLRILLKIRAINMNKDRVCRIAPAEAK